MSEATDIARQHAPLALQALVDVIQDTDSKGSEVVAAANALLDRGYGKPMQAIISVPVPARLSARLAALDDAALLAVIQDSKNLSGGSHPQNGRDTRGVDDGRSYQTQVPGASGKSLVEISTGADGNYANGGTPSIAKRRGRSTTSRGAAPVIDGELVAPATPTTPFERALASLKTDINALDDPLAS